MLVVSRSSLRSLILGNWYPLAIHQTENWHGWKMQRVTKCLAVSKVSWSPAGEINVKLIQWMIQWMCLECANSGGHQTHSTGSVWDLEGDTAIPDSLESRTPIGHSEWANVITCSATYKSRVTEGELQETNGISNTSHKAKGAYREQRNWN